MTVEGVALKGTEGSQKLRPDQTDIALAAPTWTLPFRLWFFAAISVVTIPLYVGSVATSVCFGKPSRSRSNVLARAIKCSWRTALAFCPWIRVDSSGLAPLRDVGMTGRSAFIAINHQSFFDSVCFCALCPWHLIGDVKTLMSKAVLNMPVLGQLADAVGHLPVPFKRPDASGDFSVDKARMQQIMARLDSHIDAGGHLGIFPEGSLNRTDRRQIQLFRAGGFETAIKHDMEIWGWVMSGCGDCWPPDCALGGAPSRIRIRATLLYPSAREACKKLLPDAHEEDFRAQSIALAQDVQRSMQSMLDNLFEGR